MKDSAILQNLLAAPDSKFYVLDEQESKRMGGARTNYLPSVSEVAEAIRSIPKGTTKTIHDLRNDLAKLGKAETSCPAKLLKYWKWMANLSDEFKSEHKQYDIPWWRVLKDGKCSRHMPGGIENQKKLLGYEGVILK